MFVPAIKGLGTDEQQKKWLTLAYRMQIIGCYAQTELGHGSNVQGLETTATFDPKTDEFVIHSPTLTSSKVSFKNNNKKYLLILSLMMFLSMMYACLFILFYFCLSFVLLVNKVCTL